jgi:hypothetical protein
MPNTFMMPRTDASTDYPPPSCSGILDIFLESLFKSAASSLSSVLGPDAERERLIVNYEGITRHAREKKSL